MKRINPLHACFQRTGGRWKPVHDEGELTSEPEGEPQYGRFLAAVPVIRQEAGRKRRCTAQ